MSVRGCLSTRVSDMMDWKPVQKLHCPIDNARMHVKREMNSIHEVEEGSYTYSSIPALVAY